ncbi:MAG: hypothetical protein M1822_009139 [Bathelium mastoideum]|nr:MAG: hypothetical protein M1822_009139 [Bathelium mastoideum]
MYNRETENILSSCSQTPNSIAVSLFAQHRPLSMLIARTVPRLITQLYTSSIFIQIGERHFQIDRAIFDHPGDNPNYFSLGFAIFFSTPNEVFPGLDNRGLLRPPSILPPAVPGRSADIFAELVQILQGYQVHIRNEEHRDALLRDARYFHLKGVEQKLIPHHISFNHTRHHFEIVLRLQDIRQSGISFVSDALGAIAGSDQTSSTSPAEGDSTGSASRPSPAPSSTSNPAIPATSTSTFARHLSSSTPGGGVGVGPTTPTQPGPGWVHYARPYVDEHAHALVLEIGDEATRLDLSTSPARASFSGRTHNRVAALLTVVAKQMNLPAAATGGLMMLQQSSGASGGPTAPPNVSSPGGGLGEEQRVKVFMEADADVVVDGVRWDPVIGAPVGATAVGGGAVEGPEEYEAIFEFEGREGRGRARRRRRLDGDDEGGGGIGGGLARRGIGGGGGGSEGGLGSKVWMVKNGHWRLRAQQDGRGGMEVVLVAVKIEAYASERQRNAQRGFLG